MKSKKIEPTVDAVPVGYLEGAEPPPFINMKTFVPEVDWSRPSAAAALVGNSRLLRTGTVYKGKRDRGSVTQQSAQEGGVFVPGLVPRNTMSTKALYDVMATANPNRRKLKDPIVSPAKKAHPAVATPAVATPAVATPAVATPAVATPSSEPTTLLNRDGTVAVSTTVFWSKDMRDCPVHTKVQLYSVGGIASYGTWDGRDPFYVRWSPAPRVPKDD